MFFWFWVFWVFWQFFDILARFWEALGPPKLAKNHGKSFLTRSFAKMPQKAIPGPFKGQRNAIWSLKTPFQASKTSLQCGKRIQNFCKCTFAARLTLQCSKRIQNFCKCTFAAVLTLQCSKGIQNFCKCTFPAVLIKPSSMELTGRL